MKINCGDNIKKQRNINGLSQAELGLKLGVKHGAVSSWENGRTEPNIGQIEKMCLIFNCKKSDLIGVDNAPDLWADNIGIIELKMADMNTSQLERIKKYAEYLQTRLEATQK